MEDHVLANLRRKRRYIHKQLERWEPLVARLRAFLAETEAAIAAIAPELNLPSRRYAPNPWFARQELPRLVLSILRDAGAPLSTREIAVEALGRKGVRLPDPRALKRTRLRVQQACIRFLKAELKRAGLGYKELVVKLREHGIEETEASITGKLNRGTFAVTFFLAVLAVLELEGVRLNEM
jgi:hypothetical protein